jgi:replicative DNA helicase
MMRGLHHGKWYLVGARPGGGKTSFCTTMAASIVRQEPDVQILYLSTELTEDEIVQQMCESYNGLNAIPWYPNGRDLNEVETQRLEANLGDIMRACNDGMLHIVVAKNFTVKQLEEYIDTFLVEDGRRVVFVDQASRLKRDNKWGGNFAQATEDMINGIEELAFKKQVALVLVSQLSRARESLDKGRLGLYKGSGAFEEYAHFACQLEIADTWGKNGDWSASCHVMKNRHGPTGEIPMDFIGEAHTWREVTRYRPF